jgi:ABC-2 type transport system permease protein
MRLLAAELLKIWTAPRTLLGIVLSESAIVLIGVISTLHSAESDSVLPRTLAQDVVSIGSTSLLFATLIGVLIATTEYRHGTITLAFLAAPVRERLLAAKTGAAVIASALLVLPAVLLPVGIAQIWVGGRDDYHFGSYEFELIGREFVGAAIVAMLGLVIGASSKRQLAAVIIVLGWLVFVEHAVAALFPGTTDYLPGRSIGGILGNGGEDTPSFARALVVITVYLVGLGAVAVGLTRRRDIT